MRGMPRGHSTKECSLHAGDSAYEKPIAGTHIQNSCCIAQYIAVGVTKVYIWGILLDLGIPLCVGIPLYTGIPLYVGIPLYRGITLICGYSRGYTFIWRVYDKVLTTTFEYALLCIVMISSCLLQSA